MNSIATGMESTVFVGGSPLFHTDQPVQGSYVTRDGEAYYKIANYNRMAPFFMSVVSASNHWMFVSSRGGLTAGRTNPDHALFPYANDDLIHDSNEKTGSKTIFKVHTKERTSLWEPFSDFFSGLYQIERNIYKNIPGNKLIFEEINHTLKLSFSYGWMPSDAFGFVKSARLNNWGEHEVQVDMLDGLQNLLVNGIDQQFQTEFSTLADGYKQSELLEEYNLGLFSLSSIPCDRAEPSESLRATVTWCRGLNCSHLLLSSNQLDSFRAGNPVKTEQTMRATRGAFFCHASLSIPPEGNSNWVLVADIDQDAVHLHRLIEMLSSENEMIDLVQKDVDEGTEALMKTVGQADGIQLTGNRLVSSRHFANVLFNCMRGGIFDRGYAIDKNDFLSFLRQTDQKLFQHHKTVLESWNQEINLHDFLEAIANLRDPHLRQQSLEYLPLTFSRRHGDPSRPWNRFSIDILDDRKQKIRNYQGNWRDIFQNWEALAFSFPAFLPSMVAKFLNGSTADGFNPYRVTRDGFDWEVPEPHLAWANIGYWGDHQIIYLLKLLEAFKAHDLNGLLGFLDEEVFGYLQVPYRLHSFTELLEDPHHTIEFDSDLNQRIQEKRRHAGNIACSHEGPDGQTYLVNLCEKLLVTLLAKLSHYVPDGGIWMNTQRPEWNDANNALVGYGLSMVTLCYTRRFMLFFKELLIAWDEPEISLSKEVISLFRDIQFALKRHQQIEVTPLTSDCRMEILSSLGQAGSSYRGTIYDSGFSGEKASLPVENILIFLESAITSVDRTLSVNRREDGLYHSYNLMKRSDSGELLVEHLHEMLEGQVAILSSGFLDTSEVLRVLDALRSSSLYREDQQSYLLYPNKKLPRFLEKNTVSKSLVASSELIQHLIEHDHHGIVLEDVHGDIHFHPDLRNVKVLRQKLRELEPLPGCADESELKRIETIYEETFNHRAFTGRSGTFFKYEGLGSIYWHMVSKLALAVQECWCAAQESDSHSDELNALKARYYEIKAGIGLDKTPDAYGAFPTDPYSHTPAHSGVQQPGMTGQVKEDILSRYGELGLRIQEGCLQFETSFLQNSEFLTEAQRFSFYDLDGHHVQIPLEPKSLAFTVCQVPIIYRHSDQSGLRIQWAEGNEETTKELIAPKNVSRAIFKRSGKVRAVWVNVCLVEKGKNK